MENKNDISKRILETRKQTEELKAQLQNLIESGISNIGKSNIQEKSPKVSANKVQIVKSYDRAHSGHVNKLPELKNQGTVKKDNKSEPVVNISPQKVRSYDVNKAREYIKKQREKRLEHSKSPKCDKLEIQKQKLLELHKKSRELVAKNVQLKRERSKSRDRNDFIRLDGNHRPRNRSVSRERVNISSKENDTKTSVQKENHPTKRKNPNLLYPPSPSEHYNKSRKKVEVATTDEDCNKGDKIVILQNIPINRCDNKSSDNRARQLEFKNLHEIKEEIDFHPQNKQQSQFKNILDYNKGTIGQINIPTSTITSRTAHSKLDVFNKEIEDTQTRENLENCLSKTKLQIGDNLEKCAKETQTVELKKDFPEWLQENPGQSNPYNFINTVKRKLQYAVNPSKSTADVGVQSSVKDTYKIHSSHSNFQPLFPQKISDNISQDKMKNNKQQLDLKSFISHKCLNLDGRNIEKYELVPKQNINSNLVSEVSRKIIDTESESDTSKNIPEISSESGTSLKKNAESVKRNLNSQFNLAINTSKIDNMKLVQQNLNSATTTIHTNCSKSADKGIHNSNFTTKSEDLKYISNNVIIPAISIHSDSKKLSNLQSSAVDDDYCSDFYTESDISCKSRDSIVSFNSPTYNKQVIKSPLYNGTNMKSPKSPNNNNSTSTVNTEIHVHNSSAIPQMSHSDHGHSENIPGTYLSPTTSTNKINMGKLKEIRSTDIPANVTIRRGSNRNTDKNISSATIPTDTKLRESSIGSTFSSKTQKGKFYSELNDNLIETEIGKSIVNIPTKTHSKKSSSNISTKTNSKRSSSKSESAPDFRSLYSELSSRSSTSLHYDGNIQNINTKRGSHSQSESMDLKELLPLQKPNVHLSNGEQHKNNEVIGKSCSIRNVSLESGNMSKIKNKTDVNTNTNEVHLKFEAEIHLLNDFNESLRQFSAVEKAFESLKNKGSTPKILENKDTQTSVNRKTSTSDEGTRASRNNIISTINYSRGSFIDENLETSRSSSVYKPDCSGSLISTGMELSNLNNSKDNAMLENELSLSNFENVSSKNFVGLSLNMFEQLIKDEDARLDNLKMILKIREKVLLDRTKGELAWLEIQRKHLNETGKLQEASLIKKKQRGILVNHQKEKHEMQRLKQIQKVASVERKVILKEQRNLIRQQLSTNKMLTKIKLSSPRERRQSGPLKVIQTESIRSETSISRRSSSDREKDVYSITSHHSVVSKVSEISEATISSRTATSNSNSLEAIKKTLLMRQTALQKRKRKAEELLQWHNRLLEEEKRIVELESSASAIIFQKPNKFPNVTGKHKFRGEQLNQLWYNLTGCDDKKFIKEKIYPMSQIALERFCKNAKDYSRKTKKTSDSDHSAPKIDTIISDNIPGNKNSSSVVELDQLNDQSEKITTAYDYTSDFDLDSITNEEVDVFDRSISLLINNFNKVKEDISSLNINRSQKSNEDVIDERISSASKHDKTDSEDEISVIETNKLKDGEQSNSAEIKSVISEEKADQNSIRMLLNETEEILRNQIQSSLNEIIEEVVENEESVQYTQNDSLPDTKNINENLTQSQEILNILGQVENSIAANSVSSRQTSIPSDNILKESLNTSEDILLGLSKVDERISNSENEQLSTDIATDIPSKIKFDAGKDKQTNDNSLPKSSEDDYNRTENHLPSDSIISSSGKLVEEISSKITIPDSSKNIIPIENQSSTTVETKLAEEGLESIQNKTEEEIVTDDSFEEVQEKPSSEICSEDNNIGEQEVDVLSDVTEGVLESKQTEKNQETGSVKETDIDEELSTDIASMENVAEQSKETLPLVVTDTPDIIEIEQVDVTENNASSEVTDPSTRHTMDLSYGIIDKGERNKGNMSTSESVIDDKCPPSPTSVSKEDMNLYEEKELDSLSSHTSGSQSSAATDKDDLQEKSKTDPSQEKSPKSATIDVKKRISEIMADTNHHSREDKSPRLQDLYTTTYDLVSPTNSPELGSPTEGSKAVTTSIFGDEAEEILRKQLAIEQEIKQITEQQQKEQVPFMFVREIPNKPPPPYTPPSSLPAISPVTIIPSTDEIEEITKYSSKILYRAHLSNNLESISISDNTLNLICKNITKDCFKYVFDLCKELCREHYKQVETEKCPAWLQITRKPQLAAVIPFDAVGLEKYMSKQLRELFGYEKPVKRENAIIKWSRKKRDHVDEILVLESQAEESQWINYEKDELLVMDQVTNEIMNILLKETGDIFNNMIKKRP